MQPTLTPDSIKKKQLLTRFPTVTATMSFSYIALIALMYLPGILHKDRNFAQALLSPKSNASSSSINAGLKGFDYSGTFYLLIQE